MRNKFLRLFIIIVSCIVFAVSFVGCSAASVASVPSGLDNSAVAYADDGNGVNKNAYPTAYSERGYYDGGKHEFNVSETTDYIVKNGSNQGYSIVFSATADDNVKKAVSEFKAWFAKATGIKLTQTTDTSVAYSAEAKYFCIGENSYSVAAEITKPEDLKSNGYIIKTVGKSVFVEGGLSLGTLFGVYALLNQLFGLEFYGVNTYYTKTGVGDLKLYDYNVFDNPDINENTGCFGNIYTNQTEAHRLGYETQYGDLWMMPSHNWAFHNSLYWLDPKDYHGSHPKWYAGTDYREGQLCYTAGGDAGEYELMVSTMVDKVKECIEENPEKKYISITQQDNSGWCSCSACSAVVNKYGAKSATQILFINDVAERIENWLEVEHPGREKEVKIAMFAYHATKNPPTKHPAEEEPLKLRDNAMIFLALYGALDFTHPIEDSVNQEGAAIFENWKNSAKNVGVWAYQSFYDSYMVPYCNWGVISDHLKKYAESNVALLFNQGSHNNPATTGFASLKVYLNGKLGRNVNLDPAVLTDNFFENYFGSRDGYMRKYYEELYAYLVSLMNNGTHNGKSLYGSKVGAELFPLGLLLKWTEYTEKAVEEISNIKSTDPSRYNTLFNNIKLESIMPRYFLAMYNDGYFNQTDLANLRRQFAMDCLSLSSAMLEDDGHAIASKFDGWL